MRGWSRTPALTVYTAQIQAQTVAIGDDSARDSCGIRESRIDVHSDVSRSVARGATAERTERDRAAGRGRDAGGRANRRDEQRRRTLQLRIADREGSGGGADREMARLRQRKKLRAAKQRKIRGKRLHQQRTKNPRRRMSRSTTVDMPALIFDAKAKVQPEPDPRLMAIVRRVRVRPTLIFRGSVTDGPEIAAAATPPRPPVANAPAKTTAAQGSLLNRMRSYLKRLWTRSG